MKGRVTATEFREGLQERQDLSWIRLSTEEGSLGRRQHKQAHRGKKGLSWEEPSTPVGGAWSERVWKAQLGYTVRTSIAGFALGPLGATEGF